MNDYYSLRVDVEQGCTEDYTDLLAAFLADIGYESFEPDEKGLTAYIREKDFDVAAAEEVIESLPVKLPTKVSYSLIKGVNWNEEWEKNYFKPIVVGDRCVIHSTFHKDIPAAEYDIVIDPRMAFGTGHHFTTRLILQYLLLFPLEGKSVIDMGTGTGILAILCKMRGAERVSAIEIDEPAYENACDNAVLNNVSLEIIHGDASSLSPLEPADYFIANINRNVILEDMASYAAKLKEGGRMILSGFYEEDVPMLLEKAATLGLKPESRETENRWTAICLLKIASGS